MKDDTIKINYAMVPYWELFARELKTELQQSLEEGKDAEKYRALFEATANLPDCDEKIRIADELFKLVYAAPQRADYAYREPSELEEILALRKAYPVHGSMPTDEKLKEKLTGAWFGRICGCLLGIAVEGIRTPELLAFLKASGNYPMHRYILRSDMKEENLKGIRYPLASRRLADDIVRMFPDDDTNYTVLYQELIEQRGIDFEPRHVLAAWTAWQPKNAYCTAERVAYLNYVKGYDAPASAMFENPYRELIGAQIRGDYFGYVHPGDPAAAAAMAFRDACISHVKNGIYGEMFIAAMLALAAVTDNIRDIILGGLAEIPATSRLYEKIQSVVSDADNGVTAQDCFDRIHREYNEFDGHDWCHTISNAMIVTACLLYGGSDYGKSICMAVEQGFDTDCNAATVGSILGMKNGIGSIDHVWTDPIHGELATQIDGLNVVSLADRVDMTMKHVQMIREKRQK